MRKARLRNKLAIVVDQDIIEETTSEKLLGVVVNNNLTWKEHLYGDNQKGRANNPIEEKGRYTKEVGKIHEQE